MNREASRGFTIVELLLAMSFVAALLLAVAMMVIQMAAIYNKGITLKAVNQAGQSVTQDMQYTLSSAQPLDIGENGTGGLNFRLQVQVGGQLNNPDGGRLCTGDYSYIWNTGRALANPVNRYEQSDEQIRFVKVRDVGALYCSDVSRTISRDNATEMLSAGDRELAVQSFKIKVAAMDGATQQALYSITLEIGTNDQASLAQVATINTIDTSCRPPSDSQSQRDFCAVNQFEFTARAGNRGER